MTIKVAFISSSSQSSSAMYEGAIMLQLDDGSEFVMDVGEARNLMDDLKSAIDEIERVENIGKLVL